MQKENHHQTFTPAEQAQLNNLVKNAMGFNVQRGDSLNLLNSAFNDVAETALPEIPLWKQPEIIALVKEILKYLLIAGAALYLFFGIIRPASETSRIACARLLQNLRPKWHQEKRKNLR